MSGLFDDMLCGKLAAWADAVGAKVEAVGSGAIAVSKSDLLGRLIYGDERGPSQTKCPVHLGKWSGCHVGWPGSVWTSVMDGTKTPMAVAMLLTLFFIWHMTPFAVLADRIARWMLTGIWA